MALTRSAWVRLLKVALPLGAAALVAALFLSGGRDRGEGLGVSGVSIDADGLRLTEPRFSGRLEDGAPYELRADWALPDGPDPERVELGPIRAALLPAPSEPEGRTLTLSAGSGVYRPQAGTLRLEGGVTLRTSDGYTARADGFSADLRAETARTVGPVRGDGPAGSIEAATMEAARRDGAGYIRFGGGVRVRIDPSAARGEEGR